MTPPIPIHCYNCSNLKLNCNAILNVKGSCIQCHVDGVECLFPPPPNIIQQGSLSHHGPWSFQKNCVQCTITHRRCIFDVNNQSCCKRCTKRGLSCAFKLSSQGRRNDLFTAAILPSTAEVTRTEASMAYSSPSTAETTATDASRTAMTVDKSYVNKTGGKIDDANESVLYHNLFDGDSSHVPIDHASHSGTLFPLICPHDRIPPPWVHVFSKSTKPSSLRTQAASIAHIEQDLYLARILVDPSISCHPTPILPTRSYFLPCFLYYRV